MEVISADHAGRQADAAGSLLQKHLFMKAAAADDTLSCSAVRVLMALVGFHNGQTGRCDPSYSALAHAAALKHRPSVVRAVEELEVAGWIAVERRGRNKSNGYGLALDRVDLPRKPAAGVRQTAAHLPRKKASARKTTNPARSQTNSHDAMMASILKQKLGASA